MIRLTGAMVVVLLALAGCSNSNEVGATAADVAVDSKADELVGEAVNAVLGDGPFRSRTTGRIPFISGTFNESYEQSGADLIEVRASGPVGSATAIVGDTAHEWDSLEKTWMATPLESFDPLLSPGFVLGLVLWGLIDTSGALSSMGGTPGVATGWQEVDERSDGTRRFERTLPAKTFAGEREAGGPVERLEEKAVTNRFYELAELTAIVELGPDGKLARYTVRSEFEGDPDFPDCGPLTRAVGTANLVTEFSDVGTKFNITVLDPSDLVGAYPLLAEQPDLSDDFFDSSFDDDFRNEAGQRDLTGCPTP